MPRVPRLVVPGFCHHVVQRGNNRQKVFLTTESYEKYLELLRHYVQKHSCGLCGYCLIPNHVHLLVRPSTAESLPKMMQGLNVCYQQHLNDTMDFVGHVWQSRYYSSPVDDGADLWRVAEYIDKNPLRAGLVSDPCAYPCSSALAHEQGRIDKVLTEALFTGPDARAYSEILHGEQMDAGVVERIRRCTHKNMPIGGATFVKKLAGIVGRSLVFRGRGRPRKWT